MTINTIIAFFTFSEHFVKYLSLRMSLMNSAAPINKNPRVNKDESNLISNINSATIKIKKVKNKVVFFHNLNIRITELKEEDIAYGLRITYNVQKLYSRFQFQHL